MKTRLALLGVLTAFSLTAAAWGQQAEVTAQPIQIAQAFLVAWGHERWDDFKAVTGERVAVKVGDKTYTVQPTSPEVKLVFPFRGLSTVRDNGAVTGVAIQDLGLKVGENEVRGPGTLTLEEANGSYKVVGVSSTK